MATVAASPEQEYYRDAQVLITDQRVVIGSTTFPLATISAVQLRRLPRDWRPFLLMLVMVSGLAWSVFENGLVIVGIIVSLFLGLTLILLRETKPKYTVELSQASKPVTILTSYDWDYTSRVAAALTHAHQARV
jgi:hypothetical protein